MGEALPSYAPMESGRLHFEHVPLKAVSAARTDRDAFVLPGGCAMRRRSDGRNPSGPGALKYGSEGRTRRTSASLKTNPGGRVWRRARSTGIFVLSCRFCNLEVFLRSRNWSTV